MNKITGKNTSKGVECAIWKHTIEKHFFYSILIKGQTYFCHRKNSEATFYHFFEISLEENGNKKVFEFFIFLWDKTQVLSQFFFLLQNSYSKSFFFQDIKFGGSYKKKRKKNCKLRIRWKCEKICSWITCIFQKKSTTPIKLWCATPFGGGVFLYENNFFGMFSVFLLQLKM